MSLLMKDLDTRLYRIYLAHSTVTPLGGSSRINLTDAPIFQWQRVTESNAMGASPAFLPQDVDITHLLEPFTNPSCGLLMVWQYSGSNKKSSAEVDRLVHFLLHPSFKREELVGFSCAREETLLVKFLQDPK
ncbi:uncharacterized protein EDB91DRAFT_1152493 [Suillus paluster]|uniref:uncharacterized protein n=1 Tax=Suillus paluster TaxID=48578 RepID=UPI001B86AD42|nr:uncharacterized protein EDB91DRAFT_1152493 [Suillus paluster]KAG1732263.1 hypothetical protein EDB91DRAFT_1152493 [Suillus paluster]